MGGKVKETEKKNAMTQCTACNNVICNQGFQYIPSGHTLVLQILYQNLFCRKTAIINSPQDC